MYIATWSWQVEEESCCANIFWILYESTSLHTGEMTVLPDSSPSPATATVIVLLDHKRKLPQLIDPCTTAQVVSNWCLQRPPHGWWKLIWQRLESKGHQLSSLAQGFGAVRYSPSGTTTTGQFPDFSVVSSITGVDGRILQHFSHSSMDSASKIGAPGPSGASGDAFPHLLELPEILRAPHNPRLCA